MTLTAKHLLTKKDLSIFLEDGFSYDIFKVPSVRFNDLFYNTFIGTHYGHSMLYAVKKAGGMAMYNYDRDIVPITVTFNPTSEIPTMRFIAHTIDDYSYGFFQTFQTEDEYNRFLLNVIKPWLDSFSEMPTPDEFVEFCESHNIEDIDFR